MRNFDATLDLTRIIHIKHKLKVFFDEHSYFSIRLKYD